MFLCVESIKVENGIIYNLEGHQQRLNRTRKERFGIEEPLDLQRALFVPGESREGTWKCRVLYEKDIEDIQWVPRPEKPVSTLKVVIDETVDYRWKWSVRSALDELLALKGSCDDVLILKQGLFSDASASNIVFEKDGRYLTPAAPLLRGTRRASLLAEGKIEEADISLADLSGFSRVHLINAFRDLGDCTVPVPAVDAVSLPEAESFFSAFCAWADTKDDIYQVVRRKDFAKGDYRLWIFCKNPSICTADDSVPKLFGEPINLEVLRNGEMNIQKVVYHNTFRMEFVWSDSGQLLDEDTGKILLQRN